MSVFIHKSVKSQWYKSAHSQTPVNVAPQSENYTSNRQTTVFAREPMVQVCIIRPLCSLKLRHFRPTKMHEASFASRIKFDSSQRKKISPQFSQAPNEEILERSRVNGTAR
ncbi:hypothetical protein QLX08_008195 [Tetragonisca angustula]|uniref:Uncharacterized protein n=1 Tax=Tetragonisca angustula TaxID=166442 RepID=A0AAW0ZLS8_9HYME